MTSHATEQTTRWKPSDTFAARILLCRVQRGMTQQQAADAAGVKRATWALWENGSSPRDLAHVVAGIADGLGVDRDWLMWGGPLAPSGRSQEFTGTTWSSSMPFWALSPSPGSPPALVSRRKVALGA